MTRTRRGVRALVTPLALLLALGAAALPAWAAQALKPFTATYDVKYMGLNGKATMVLAPTGDNAWKYSLDIDSAIANLSQNTVFEADGGRWRPLSNSDSTMLLIKKNARHASYDWNKREARGPATSARPAPAGGAARRRPGRDVAELAIRASRRRQRWINQVDTAAPSRCAKGGRHGAVKVAGSRVPRPGSRRVERQATTVDVPARVAGAELQRKAARTRWTGPHFDRVKMCLGAARKRDRESLRLSGLRRSHKQSSGDLAPRPAAS